jgi:hypothetical protein
MTTTKRALALVAAVLLVASGCTGGDEGQTVTAGNTAADDLTLAVDATRAGTGRYEATFRSGTSEAGWSDTVRGEFSGGDHAAAMDGGSDADGLALEERWTVVGGRQLFSLTGLQDAPEVDGSVGPFSSGSMFGAATLPDGIEWVDLTDADLTDVMAGWYWMLTPVVEVTSPFKLLDLVTDVVDAGAGEVDGVPTGRFTATIPAEQFLRLSGFDTMQQMMLLGDDGTSGVDGGDGTGEPPAEMLGVEGFAELTRRYDAYYREYLTVDTEIHVVDGRLRRAEFTPFLQFPPEYPSCSLVDDAGAGTFGIAFDLGGVYTIDYADLGADVVVAVPAPETVMSLDELAAAAGDWSPEGEDWFHDEELHGDDRTFDPGTILETADGPRPRFELEEDLAEFGELVGVPGDLLDADDVVLVEAYDRASAAMAALPGIATVFGELKRPELLVNLRWGMIAPMPEFDDLVDEPGGAVDQPGDHLDLLTDEQLGAALDDRVGAHIASGDLPDDPARLRTLLTLWGDDASVDDDIFQKWMELEMDLSDEGMGGLWGDGDPFAGCPPLPGDDPGSTAGG